MADWYRCMEGSHTIPPAFALVSGSPVQISDRVEAFLRHNRFPDFGLYLRHLGPDTLQDYKQPVIRRLLHQFAQPAVLIGDSGEHDPEVYREIRQEFPGRVQVVFIRDVGHSEDKMRFADMHLFSKAEEARAIAERMGLTTKDCRPDAVVQ
jgi:phosphatidate phosphatase APP1